MAAASLEAAPPQAIGQAFGAMFTYLGELGEMPTGVAYEFYVGDPDSSPPEELLTQIAFPLKS